MNADEIYKKYIAPPVVEPEPDEAKNQWHMPLDDIKTLTAYDWQIKGHDYGPFKLMNPNTGFDSAMRNNSYIRDVPPPLQIKNIDVSIDNSRIAQRVITILVHYSVGDVWSGLEAAQFIYNDPGRIPSDLLDSMAQRLINGISIEIKNRFIADPLKEQLSAKMEELYRRGL